MKTVLTALLLLFATTMFSQKTKRPESNSFIEVTAPPESVADVHGDTIIINPKYIKYVKINDKVYKVKVDVSLEEVQQSTLSISQYYQNNNPFIQLAPSTNNVTKQQ